MRIRWLGWAGVEIEADGERVVVDPLDDPLAVFAWLGESASSIPLPEVVAARPGALAGLLTHLHRDHADAAALTAALSDGAPVFEPLDYGGEALERLNGSGFLAAAIHARSSLANINRLVELKTGKLASVVDA